MFRFSALRPLACAARLPVAAPLRRVAQLSTGSVAKARPASLPWTTVGLAAVGVATTATLLCASEEKVYSSCDLIGEGFGSEIWKARHKNIEILELEHQTVQMLMTKLRDATVEGEEFTFYADRLLNFLIEQGISALPTEEDVVTTPDGDKYEGIKFAEDVHKLCGVTVSADSKLISPALGRLLPGLETGFIVTSPNKDKKTIVSTQLPADLKDRFVLLLDPIIRYGSAVELSLQLLKNAGVTEDRIVVLTLTMSPGAADAMRKYPDVKVISASIESGIDDSGRLVPGMGIFEQRYEAGRKPQAK